MSADNDEFVTFKDDHVLVAAAEPALAVAGSGAKTPWRVLIVDDDADVHSATEFALSGLEILERPLQFFHAYSGNEAIDLLMAESDIAVVLLDVVMETEEAGLAAISTIRTDLGLSNTQIILRTGQPGYAPELETIRRYEINDYRTKSELSRVKLYTALTASIRTYEHLRRLDSARRGVELVVSTGAEILDAQTPDKALHVMLTRALQLLDTGDRAIVLGGPDEACDAKQILAATGNWLLNAKLPFAAATSELRQLASERVEQALRERRTLVDSVAYTMYLPAAKAPPLLVFVPNDKGAPLVPRQLIDVFVANVAVCADNLSMVERLADLAYGDSLTGLASRRGFVQRLDERLAQLPRNATAILLLDVDQFAETNDMFGHRYGDELLRGIGDRLQSALPADVVIARLAADSFALLGNPDQLVVADVRNLFVAPFVFEGDERTISITSGLVLAAEAEDGSDGSDLLKDASIVIKRAKANGLGRHATYSREFREQNRDHTRTLHELGSAFRKQELYLVYQPQFELGGKRLIGFEALIRWRTADGKYIPPDRFIPIAENSGLIRPIGNWVLSTALADLARLQQTGHRGLRMAVNVSAKQLSSDEFLHHLDVVLAATGVGPDNVELEITESASILGFDQLNEQLSAFRQRGVAIAIDDFGTGYSSLSYLDQLPADRLKIDRAFVNALTDEKQGPRIAEMVIPLGRALGMKVLAEGVETETQAQMLTDLGCHEAQGYLFARPMPFDDLAAWLAARTTS